VDSFLRSVFKRRHGLDSSVLLGIPAIDQFFELSQHVPTAALAMKKTNIARKKNTSNFVRPGSKTLLDDKAKRFQIPRSMLSFLTDLGDEEPTKPEGEPLGVLPYEGGTLTAWFVGPDATM
jgi:hypothetical protein